MSVFSCCYCYNQVQSQSTNLHHNTQANQQHENWLPQQKETPKIAHLLASERSDGSLCDFCGQNPKSKRIHDKLKIRFIHEDARILEICNKELKIARAATTTLGGLTTAGVAGGRMAYKGKIGKKTGGAMTVAGGAFAVLVGIMDIYDAATAKIPQERCSTCNRVFSSPGCRPMCMAPGGCGGRCIGNNWKMATDDGQCCYHICDKCFAQLTG